MKAGRDYSWWVEYSYTWEYYDEETHEWLPDWDSNAMRFVCRKKDIKKTVTKHIKENEIDDENYRNLVVAVTDSYMTTPTEV